MTTDDNGNSIPEANIVMKSPRDSKRRLPRKHRDLQVIDDDDNLQSQGNKNIGGANVLAIDMPVEKSITKAGPLLDNGPDNLSTYVPQVFGSYSISFEYLSPDEEDRARENDFHWLDMRNRHYYEDDPDYHETDCFTGDNFTRDANIVQPIELVTKSTLQVQKHSPQKRKITQMVDTDNLESLSNYPSRRSNKVSTSLQPTTSVPGRHKRRKQEPVQWKDNRPGLDKDWVINCVCQKKNKNTEQELIQRGDGKAWHHIKCQKNWKTLERHSRSWKIFVCELCVAVR
jgi:hypothetical protein